MDQSELEEGWGLKEPTPSPSGSSNAKGETESLRKRLLKQSTQLPESASPNTPPHSLESSTY